jgi:hypothetical protein
MAVKTTTKKPIKVSKAKARLTPAQIAWNIPLGAGMEAFFGNATKKDFAQKNKLYEAFTETLDQFRADSAVNTRHFAMAAIDLARVALLAHAEHAQKQAAQPSPRARPGSAGQEKKMIFPAEFEKFAGVPDKKVQKAERTEKINKLQRKHPGTKRQISYDGGGKYSVLFIDKKSGLVAADYNL